MRTYTDINNIDFSIIRERALRNIREDLFEANKNWVDEMEFNDAFDAVVRYHKATAEIEDYVPVLVEAEMKERLRTGQLFPAVA